MDVEYVTCRSKLQLALMAMRERERRLRRTRNRLSRHYNRLQHTVIVVALLEELLGVMEQDPDNWEDEPDLIPF